MLTKTTIYKIVDQLKIFDFILENETRLINMMTAVAAIKLNTKTVLVPKTNKLLYNNPNPS